MKWYNYKALSVNTPLDSKSVILPSDLLSFIKDMGDKTTLYHCYYELEERKTYVGYEGMLRPAFGIVHIDLDSEADMGQAAWADAKALRERLLSEGVPARVYFSGNKGFHVAFASAAAGIGVGAKLVVESKVKSLLVGLQSIYPTVDLRIWNANRKFRAYRSRHEKSGLYKIEVTDFTMSLDDIRKLADFQPEASESWLPTQVTNQNPWLTQLASNATTSQAPGTKKQTKEISQGKTIDDDSMRFRNFADKKCTQNMRTLWYPQFNRHDIGLRLMTDAFDTGIPLAKAKELISEWASTVFDDATRVADSIRQLSDTYTKPQDYKFGCYDDVKKAYCSAKCKLYDQLDRARRARPMDATKTQSKDNLASAQADSDKISEGELADILCAQLGEVCKVSGDYFKWKTTHWERIDRERFEYMMTSFAIAAYGNKASSKKLASLITQIKMKIPVAPETNCFYQASLNKFNFTDCTATVLKDEHGNTKLVTKEHDPKDYLAYCAPFPLQADSGLPRSGEFLHYLETREADSGPEGLRTIKQMLGASLIPYVPRIFFIVGKSNSGKSTLALLIKKLLGPDNVSDVAPIKGLGERFNWEPSIGKIANIVTELDNREILDVNTLKKVRDKASIAVDRKGQKKVLATLPFIHIYCCNELPASLEGNSGALNNRVSMLYFKPGYLNGLSGIAELSEHLWANDAASILDVAREGLADLVASGFRYHESEASKEAVKDWQKTNDPIELFVEDIQNNEHVFVTQPDNYSANGFVKGSQLYESFKEWSAASGRRHVLGRHKFYSLIASKYNLECQPRGEGGLRLKVGPLFGPDKSEF